MNEGNCIHVLRLASLYEAWRARPEVDNLIDAENNGSSEEITNTGVGGMNAAAPLVDLEALDFRPKPGSALASGAKDLSSTGWPGASNAVWRGALDPNETGSAQVGPRQPA